MRDKYNLKDISWQIIWPAGVNTDSSQLLAVNKGVKVWVSRWLGLSDSHRLPTGGGYQSKGFGNRARARARARVKGSKGGQEEVKVTQQAA